MLKRQFRLSANTRLQHPCSYQASTFSVKYTPSTLPHSRFGFVVRKAIDRRATKRNRIRRVFRSCIEEMFDQIVPGYDMLFFLKQGIIDKERSEVCREVGRFLSERTLLKT